MAGSSEKKARWYVVNVQSNMEKKVREIILEKAEDRGWSEMIEEILIPMETVVDVVNSKKVQVERKFFPGYILVKVQLTDDLWHLIRDIPRVAGFLGARNKPIPVSQKEIDRILAQAEVKSAEKVEVDSFMVGEEIKVMAGAFSGFTGVIEDIDLEKKLLKIKVSIFGRETPVTLEGDQVEKFPDE